MTLCTFVVKKLTADKPSTSTASALVPSDINELVPQALNAALAKFSDKITDIVNSRFAAESRPVVIERDVRAMQQNLANQESLVVIELDVRDMQQQNLAHQENLVVIERDVRDMHLRLCLSMANTLHPI